MKSQLLNDNTQSARDWLVGTGAAVAIVAVAAYVSINGQQARAMIEREHAEQVEQENQLFCTKFGAAPGTAAFATCATDLALIRQKHKDRLNWDLGPF